jgi:hypothetical protein
MEKVDEEEKDRERESKKLEWWTHFSKTVWCQTSVNPSRHSRCYMRAEEQTVGRLMERF